MARYRPVDPDQSLPRARGAGARALARARRLPRVDPPARGRAAVRLLRGAADRQRAAGLPPRARARLQGRLPALQDDARPPRARARRGWDCHGLPVELEVERELGISVEGRHRALRRRRVQRALPRVGARATSTSGTGSPSGSASGSTLDDAYFTLDNDYIESVWWALKQVWDKGLLYEGHKVVPYCPRCGTALSIARGRARLPGRGRPVASTCASRSTGERRACRCSVWTTTPWTLLSNAALAVDPDVDLRARAARRRGARSLAEALVERVLGEDAEVRRRASPGSELVGHRYEPPFPYITATTATRGHTRARRPTSSPPRTAPASCTPRSPSARTTSGSASSYGLTVSNPVRARRHLRRAHRPVRRPLRARRPTRT